MCGALPSPVLASNWPIWCRFDVFTAIFRLQVISPEIAAGLKPFGRTEGLPGPDPPGRRRIQPKYQTRGILPGVGGAVYGNFDIIFGPFLDHLSRTCQLQPRHATPHAPCAIIYRVHVLVGCTATSTSVLDRFPRTSQLDNPATPHAPCAVIYRVHVLIGCRFVFRLQWCDRFGTPMVCDLFGTAGPRRLARPRCLTGRSGTTMPRSPPPTTPRRPQPRSNDFDIILTRVSRIISCLPPLCGPCGVLYVVTMVIGG